MNHDHGMLIERTPSSQDSLPDSQASFASIASTAASVIGAPRLLSSSSNISTSTISDTQLTSPISSTGAFSQFQQKENLASPKAGKEAIAPPPRLDTNVQPLSTKLAVNAGSGSSDNASTITSPMSIDTPGLTHGSKRTASGTVKSATAFSMDSPQRTGGYGHARNMSLESNASNVSRVGELSAQLKTRLSYAMVKVQHGWERQSLDELEEQTSRKPSPLSHMRPGERLHHSDSPQSYTRRRSSGQSDSPDRLMFSPGSQPTPSSYSRNSTPGRFSNQSPTYGSTAINHGAMPVTSSGQAYQLPPAQTSPVGRALAPAAPIVSRRPRRSNSTHAPPSLLSTQRAGKSQSDLGPATKPPTTPRAGILRMPSQQAEKDAVDTLLFMSSPNNSAYVSQVSNSATQPSPLRSDFTMAPKRVVFEMEGMDGMTKAMNVPHLPYPNSQPS